MREHGLSVQPRQHRTRTTDSQHEHPVAPNLPNREFTATAPNTRVGRRYHGDLDSRGLALVFPSSSTFTRASWSAGPWMRIAIFEYLEAFYHRQRLHSSLGYVSPVTYEQQVK